MALGMTVNLTPISMLRLVCVSTGVSHYCLTMEFLCAADLLCTEDSNGLACVDQIAVDS